MKFIICLVVLAACAEALPGRKDLRSTGVKVNPRGSDEGCDDPVQEVRVAAGQVLEGAIVSDTESDGLYPNNACQEWKIITDVNLCINISVGDGGFSTQILLDSVTIKDSESSSVKYATGDHPIGYWLLVSETNNVDVKFTSHKNSRRGAGFSLDVRSIPCVTRCHDPVQDVRVAAGETLRGALVTHTNSDGLYPNWACQEWKLITDENQCFVISVGDVGFNTEWRNDFLTFKDTDSVWYKRDHGRFYSIGQILFRSQTNSVDVKFTSNLNGGRSGFSLDVRSTSCAWPNFCDDPVQEVVVAANETLEGAIVSHTESDGLYPTNSCQDWKITTVESQCIVITVGEGGFSTESWRDFVSFKDSNLPRTREGIELRVP